MNKFRKCYESTKKKDFHEKILFWKWKLPPARVDIPPIMFILLATEALEGCEKL